VCTLRKWHPLKIYFKLRNHTHSRHPDTRNHQVQTDSLYNVLLAVAVTVTHLTAHEFYNHAVGIKKYSLYLPIGWGVDGEKFCARWLLHICAEMYNPHRK